MRLHPFVADAIAASVCLGTCAFIIRVPLAHVPSDTAVHTSDQYHHSETLFLHAPRQILVSSRPAVPYNLTAPVSPERRMLNQRAGGVAITRISGVVLPTQSPQSIAAVNDAARAALVNIFCTPRGGGSINPMLASGVMIDSRGVILTNAHVAQYVLLSENARVNLSCVARTGAPATARMAIEVLYMPPVWVAEHAKDIRQHQAMGTGEHDWALLRVVGILHNDTDTEDALFPFVPVDVRENSQSIGELVLVASYPAEFVGGTIAQTNLFPATSVTSIQQLLTFASSTVDAFSLGGVIEAQSGSSGGGVLNRRGHLIGLITTTSGGATTAERDLHAITPHYINRDITAQLGVDLQTFLAGNLAEREAAFNEYIRPALLNTLIDALHRY